MTRLRIGVDARLTTAMFGGVEQALIGLAHGLAQLEDGDEEYLFLVYKDAHAWLTPYLGGRCRLVLGLPTSRRPQWTNWLKPVWPLARSMWHQFSPVLGQQSVAVPRSDGILERAGVTLVHFPTQNGFLTDLPSIYQPWDLQHRHLPQFFTPRERLARDILYGTFCSQAALMTVPTAWGKQDLIEQFGLPENKIAIVPGAPVLGAYTSPSASDVASTQRRFSLPETFLLYPAQTWAHKNHIGMLKALACLRDTQQLTVPVICSGRINEFFPRIERQMHNLGLANQVRFLGFVSPLELQCLYQLCRGLIFPSTFEGLGMPILEAFLARVPVACSNVACLPELASDAAILFDPSQTHDIARAIQQLWTDELLRQRLIERGRQIVSHYSWERTARIFRAHYRRLANHPLTDQDRTLLVTSQGECIKRP